MARIARLVAGPLLAAMLLLPAVGAWAAASEESMEFLEDAEEFLAKGDVEAAVIQLKNAIKSDPDNVEARMMLGGIYLAGGAGQAAEKEFRAAIRRGVEDPAATVRLGRALLLQNKFDEALQEVPTNQEDAKLRAEAFIVRGLAQLGLGQVDEAESSLRKAEELDPASAGIQVALTQLFLRRDDRAGAEVAIDRALALDPELVEAMVVKGELRRLEKDLPGAIEHFDRALAKQPDNGRALLGRAAALIDQGKLESAKADVNAVLAVAPEQPLANFLLAMIRAKQGDLPGAADALQAGGPALASYLPAQFLSAAIDYAQGEVEQAIAMLESYLVSVPQNTQARKLLAAAYLRKGDPEKATSLLEALRRNDPDDAQVMTLLGNAYVRTGRFAEASDLYQQAVERNPGAAALRMQLALSQVAGGDLEAAAGELSTVIDLDPDQSQAQVLLVLVKLREQKFDEALTALEALQTRNPDNPLVDNLRGAARLGKGDAAGARESFEAALAKRADFVPALLNLAQLDLRDGKTDAAKARFESVLVADPKRQEARVSLAQMAAAAGDLAAAEAMLREGVEADRAKAGPRLALADFLAQRGMLEKAITVLREAELEFPDEPAIQRGIGVALRAQGDLAGAIQTFRRLVDMTPGSVSSLFQLAQAQADAGQSADAAVTLERARQIDPQDVDLRVLTAEVAVANNRLDEAMAIATALRDQYPDRAIGYLVLGGVQASQGWFREAAAQYTEALARENTAETAIRRFESQRMADLDDQAFADLTAWAAANPGNDLVDFTLAGAYLDAGRYDEAIAIYEGILAKGIQSVIALNNLAWLYDRKGDPRAVETAEKAVEMAPNESAVIDTLGWILVGRGDAQRGLELLLKATTLAPEHAEIQYHFAAALAKVGRRDEACRTLGDVLGGGASFRGVEEARELSRELGCG
jgi:putative PEP-CTERM system TPR-repeat lipoprotein